MASVCFYFQVHQSYRLRRYSVFDTEPNYFDAEQTAALVREAAEKSYLPTNRMLLETIRANKGKFRIAFSITGTALDLLEQHAPEVFESFRELGRTGCVEFLDETYFHSLSFLYSKDEFREQVELHRSRIKSVFDQEPRVFRNTELIYSNELGHELCRMGYDGVLTEGADHVLGCKSPNFPYHPPHAAKFKLLLKNYRLSDDITQRFSNKSWAQWPLTADKFARWIGQINGHGNVCNLFMDYEVLGRHQQTDAGIYDFIRHLPREILKHRDNDFLTPSQVVDRYPSAGELEVANPISWADSGRDLSAWLGNAMQSNALHELYKLEGDLKKKNDPVLLADWRKLTSSDHFYYMCTRYWAEGEMDKAPSPYESPYDGYINFMNVLDNIQTRAKE